MFQRVSDKPNFCCVPCFPLHATPRHMWPAERLCRRRIVVVVVVVVVHFVVVFVFVFVVVVVVVVVVHFVVVFVFVVVVFVVVVVVAVLVVVTVVIVGVDCRRWAALVVTWPSSEWLSLLRRVDGKFVCC